MRDRLDEFGADVTVVLVTFTQSEQLVNYAERNQLPFPVLTDPERLSYRRFGLGRGSIARIYGLKTIHRYYELYRIQGFRRRQRATEDTLQLGGDFVIDPTGTLVYGFWGEGPADRPPVDDLITAVSDSRTR